MNIFATHLSPIISAQNLCDVHVRKMLLESVQLLCTYLNSNGIPTPYKTTHKNHPCQLWLEKDIQNIQWLKVHTQTLIDEYRLRFNKLHASAQVFDEYCWYNLPTTPVTNIQFVQVIPDQYKDADVIKAYRNYYLSKYIDWEAKFNLYKKDYNLYVQTYFMGDFSDKKRIPARMVWTNRNMPDWLCE